MDPIYVTGHRNPDTDSIVAAIAYASLRNALGDREYEAACLGRVSDETQLVLNLFGFAPPTLISNLYTQVQDLEFLEGSQLLYVGDDDVISQAFGVTPRDNEVFLPKVMSRKKQIIPSLSALWG